MKIHINVLDDIPPTVALNCVSKVVAEGRISNGGKSYCYATSFYTSVGEVWVTTAQYRKSDCFTVKLKEN